MELEIVGSRLGMKDEVVDTEVHDLVVDVTIYRMLYENEIEDTHQPLPSVLVSDVEGARRRSWLLLPRWIIEEGAMGRDIWLDSLV